MHVLQASAHEISALLIRVTAEEVVSRSRTSSEAGACQVCNHLNIALTGT